MSIASVVHQLRTPDGLTLTVEEAGAGLPLVFAHGLTVNRSQSRRQLFHLADRYRVIVFDQRGHADSSPISNEQQFNLSRMAEDIGFILDSLSIDTAYVGGESLGAGTALRFALSHPVRVSALMLCLPALGRELNPMRQTILDLGLAIRSLGLSAFAGQNARNEIGAGMPEATARAWADVLRSHQTESMATACELASTWLIYDEDSELDALRMPVHIAAIEDDPVHPLTLAQHLHTHILGSSLSLIKPARRYYTNPSCVGDDLRAFLDSIN